MLDGLNRADLPDPSDCGAAWVDGIPAYEAWWQRAMEWAAGGPDRRPWDLVRQAELIAYYGEAVPTRPALNALLSLGPLLEIGAGRGHWSRLLRDLGGDVVTTDPKPVGKESWASRSDPPWTEVATVDHYAAWDHPERALLVCWPPRPSGFAVDLVERAPQSTLALVTDGRNLDADRMYDCLELKWEAEQTVALPQWPMRFDSLTIWRRREIAAPA